MDEETVAIVRALVNNKNTSTNERPRFFCPGRLLEF